MHRRCETISLRNGTPSSLLPLTLSKYVYGLRTGRKITQMQARRDLLEISSGSEEPEGCVSACLCVRVLRSQCLGQLGKKGVN